MSGFNLSDNPHRRYNPLTGEWVLVSPHHTRRPWLGQNEDAPEDIRPAYDPACSLCQGNTRAGGIKNPNYPNTLPEAGAGKGSADCLRQRSLRRPRSILDSLAF